MPSEKQKIAKALKQRVHSLELFGIKHIPSSGKIFKQTVRVEVAAKSPKTGTVKVSKQARLDQLAQKVMQCRNCSLYKTRTKMVFSDGSPDARLVFIGEAPGRDEDMQGKPFVGRAGVLLTKMIEAIGFKRGDVYICNVLKDRPPGNRTPDPKEMEACFPFLEEQLAIIQPEVICTLGAVATKAFLGPNIAITKIRGTIQDYKGIRLVPSFHPAYLLRNPPAKKYSWIDLKLVKKLLESN